MARRKQGQRVGQKMAASKGGKVGAASEARGRGGPLAMDSDGWTRVKRCVWPGGLRNRVESTDGAESSKNDCVGFMDKPFLRSDLGMLVGGA